MKPSCIRLIAKLLLTLCLFVAKPVYAQPVTLAEALDAPQLTWTTSGSQPWTGQTSVTQDGVDAARSGLIGNNQQSSLQTTVTGPGTLTFWWKVSSEDFADVLQFFINGVLEGDISGEVDWEERTFHLGSGTKTLVWRYRKDISDSFGTDRGWVDLVSFGPPTGPPIIDTQPQSQSLVAGSTATFKVMAVGVAPLSYQWFKDETILTDATNNIFSIVNVQTNDSGSYFVEVGSPDGSVNSELAELIVLPPTNGVPFLNPTPASGDEFGASLAALGTDRVVIGAPGDDTSGADAGAAYLFSTNRVLLTTFSNPTPAVDDEFGTSVAALGSDRVIIGAPRDNTGASRAGAAYLFSANGTLLTTFNNPTPAFAEEFGIAVTAVGTDRVLVGAWGENNTTVFSAGAAYLFSTNGTLLTTFTNPTPAIGDAFGAAVTALGSNRVLISAPQDNTGASLAGAAYLFNTAGILLTTFTNPTPANQELFGFAIAAVGSDRVLIGSPSDSLGASSAGVAYLFSTNGTLLTTFSNPTPVGFDFFGGAVAAVGSEGVIIGSFSGQAGEAYLFNTAGTLVLTIPSPLFVTEFAAAVAGVGNNAVLIGAPTGNDPGAVYWFDVVVPPATGPATIATHPQSQTVVEGRNASFSVLAGGQPPLNYQWFKGASALVGATNRTYAITNAQPSHAGTYSVVVSNALGSVMSSNAVLSVLPFTVSTQSISLNTPTSSTIEQVTEIDDWTFFGRAGQTVAVVAEIGFGVDEPSLNFAEVRLFTPSSNLLARGSNNVSGQFVILTNNVLPVDGTYRVRIQVPLDRPEATGNYRLTVWEAITDVSTVVLNQTTYGRIETPYSVDRWTFSARAGQVVDFDLINESGFTIVFGLTGPGGWVGFSDSFGSVEFNVLPQNGVYTLTARRIDRFTDDIAYAFRFVEISQTDLPLGTNFVGQFTGSGQAQIFKITVTNAGPLRISLVNTGSSNRTELYASRGIPPTRGNYEQESAAGPDSSRELFIPSASVGELYVLVYGDSIPTPGPFTIRASSPGIVLAGITPNRQVYNASFAMALTGAGFEPGDVVELIPSGGGPPRGATNVSLDTYSQLTATFPPSPTSAFNPYSVRVTQLDGDTVTLTNAFQMLGVQQFPAIPGYDRNPLKTRLILPGALGRNTPATIYVEYSNVGHATLPAPLLILKSSDPDGSDRPILSLDESRLAQNFWSAGMPPGTAHEIFILASGDQPGVLNPGEERTVPVYYLGLLEPWNTADSKVELELRYWGAADPSPIDWTARKTSLRPPTLDAATWDVVFANLVSGLATTGDYVKMLNDNARFLGRLGQNVTDVDKLWNFELQQAWGYTPMSVLDSVTDAALPVPGLALEFSRRFSSNIRARNSTGLFGRGWYTVWQSQLVIENSGALVRIVGEAGAAQVFTRDTRMPNTYFSGAGDSSALTSLGGGVFDLRQPNGTVSRFRSDGRISYVEDVNGNRVTAGYNGSGRIISLTHSSGGSITIGYNGSGLVSSVSDSAGRTTTYAYGGGYLQNVTTTDGKVTTYTYETGGNAAQRHALRSITRGGTTRSFTFDTRGRLASSFVAAGESLVRYSYDSAGGVYVADTVGTNALLFDHNGLVAKTQDPLGNITLSEFDADLRLKRLVTPTGESQRFTWCACGSPTSITDERGHTTRFAYDNPFRRLTSFTDARGSTTRYAYDDKGNLLTTTYPDFSRESFSGYTSAGLPGNSFNRRSQSITYAYTVSGQIQSQSFDDGSYNEFFYDPRGNLTNVTEHPAEGIERITSYFFDYASAGDRLRKVTYPNESWVEFFYDNFGRRARMTDVTGQDLRYDYDAAGRLWRLRDAANAVIVEYLYNATGRLRRINKENGTYTTYEYDAAGQILHLINHAPNGSVNSRFDYTYDRRGRRTSMGTLDGNWTYDYDGTGQLIRARLASTNAQIPNQDLQYNYDPLGNRTHTVSNGVRADYVANELNQYTSVDGVEYQYDFDGNLTFDGVRNYEYNVQNRLVRVTGPDGVTEYEYDVIGSRTASVVNGQRKEYLLDPSGLVNVLAEHDDMGQLLARNVHGIGLVGRSVGANQLNFMDFDALGSTVAVTGSGGAVNNSYAFSPFGTIIHSVQTISNPFCFVGQVGVTDEQKEINSIRMRFYHSTLGRFVSTDPIGVSRGTVNLYEYALNDPVKWIDPNGKDAVTDVVGNITAGLSLFGGATGGAANVTGATSVWAFFGGATVSEIAVAGSWVTGAFLLGYGIGNLLLEYALPDSWKTDIGDWLAEKDGLTEMYNDWESSGPGGEPPGDPGDESNSEVSTSTDPNEKFGARGVGAQNWITPDAIIPYRINFENLSSATAPAQEVVITDRLSTNLNWHSFQLTELGFGDVIIPVPPNRQHFESSVLVTCCDDLFEVQVEAGINLASGEVRVVFRSINPNTSLPPPVSVGFLPPEDGTGRGQGHVSYLINAKTNLATGTAIRNVALITFDRQQSIATDQIDPQNAGAGIDPAKQALNTIDAGAPSSSVAALPVESGRSFIVTWSGQDDPGGSGIARYSLFVSTNGGDFGLWLESADAGGAVFQGELTKTYAFYSVAVDHVGNLELPPMTVDSQTTVSTNSPILATVTDGSIMVGSPFSFTNRVIQGLPVGEYTFSLLDGPFGASVNPTNGTFSWIPSCEQGRTTNLVTVWVTDSARTNLSDAAIFSLAVQECLRPVLGDVIIPAGFRGRVPINLETTEALTNLTAILSLPPERLTSPLIEAAAQVCVTGFAGDLGGGRYMLTLNTCNGGIMTGRQQVGWLNLLAVTNQSSVFVAIQLTNITGKTSSGLQVSNIFSGAGRVVILGDEPLLECILRTNRQPALLLYGLTNRTFAIESSLDVTQPVPWPVSWQGAMTNLVRTFDLEGGTNKKEFFRARPE